MKSTICKQNYQAKVDFNAVIPEFKQIFNLNLKIFKLIRKPQSGPGFLINSHRGAALVSVACLAPGRAAHCLRVKHRRKLQQPLLALTASEVLKCYRDCQVSSDDMAIMYREALEAVEPHQGRSVKQTTSTDDAYEVYPTLSNAKSPFKVMRGTGACLRFLMYADKQSGMHVTGHYKS
ncbi:hypothetical protein EGR_03319 [Echinococcus granulosus]|uniref:Uncharacterized protein n=1 Tax=Echinococcus granulosus TaxID=6210 RepID=W6UL32_ECHGR|nr:hypothetical protein EGR_03319 [Echinococcus granulosus]EUB61773.1 hypothetical protein EGR_03319 [Echinococcus granulosus]